MLQHRGCCVTQSQLWLREHRWDQSCFPSREPFFSFHRTGTKFISGLLVCVWLSLAAPDVVLPLCLPDTRRKPGLSSLPVVAVSLLLVFRPFFLLCCGRQLSASPRVSAALTSSGGRARDMTSLHGERVLGAKREKPVKKGGW